MAYAYDILYNDKNDFKTIQNLKNNYLKPYYDNINNFEQDIPVEVRSICLDELLTYTLNCEDRLNCLVDISTPQSLINGLNELSKTIKNNVKLGIKIGDAYSSNWTVSKTEALEWINLQEKNVDKLKISDVEKAKMKYFFNSKLYELMHNSNYLSIRYSESSLNNEISKSKSKCKADAICAANEYFSKFSSTLESKGISKKDVEQLNVAKNKFEKKINDSDSDGVIVEIMNNQQTFTFKNTYDTLHYLMLYFYLNPDKINEMYDMN